MKILVTGGAGYIGSHTCVVLLQAGHDVTVIDNLCNSSAIALERVQELAGRPLRFVNGDIRSRTDLDKAFEGLVQVGAAADVAVHEAQRPAGEFLHALERDGGTVAEVVDDGDVMPGLQQDHAGVAADVAGPAGDEDFHGEACGASPAPRWRWRTRASRAWPAPTTTGAWALRMTDYRRPSTASRGSTYFTSYTTLASALPNPRTPSPPSARNSSCATASTMAS